MSGIKQQIIKLVSSMPDDVTLDEVMAELYFKKKIDAGLKELDENNGIPHKQVEKQMSNISR
jgi:hypothetical protein